jgi:phosphatidate phosphatase APP1
MPIFTSKALLRPLSKAEAAFDRWKFERRIRKGKLGEVIIFPYRGYGNAEEINIMGRVLENNGIAKPRPEDSTWTNIKAMALRYLSREIPHVHIKASFMGEEKTVQADEEGYFHLQLPYHDAVADDRLWHDIRFRLIDRLLPDQESIYATGEVMIPDRQSEFGIISDIDDTILISKTTHRIEIIRMALVHNATTRLAFRGVASFYRALQQGSDGQKHNPVFYVSSSPWNMYDMLEDFFRINELPKGPILLRDIGLTANRFIKDKHARHKLDKIRRIMHYNPGLRFILIGDSGQHDPEIYRQVNEDFPGRVKAIYIRDVTHAKRKAEVEQLAREMQALGVPFVVKSATSDAAIHAEEAGFIRQGSCRDVFSKT